MPWKTEERDTYRQTDRQPNRQTVSLAKNLVRRIGYGTRRTERARHVKLDVESDMGSDLTITLSWSEYFFCDRPDDTSLLIL